MPRSSRSSRPTPRSSSSSTSTPSGSRSASSVAAPRAPPASSAAPPAPPQAGQQPGMLAQMAATAGSVAVGSTIGHGISHMLFGGRAQEGSPADAGSNSMQQTTAAAGNCEFQAKEFTKCLDAVDVQTCSWFLEQLKACQAAASRY